MMGLCWWVVNGRSQAYSAMKVALSYIAQKGDGASKKNNGQVSQNFPLLYTSTHPSATVS